jgi:hypothetical protein
MTRSRNAALPADKRAVRWDLKEFTSFATCLIRSAMILLRNCLSGLLFGLFLYWGAPLVADDQVQAITENECARRKDAEIVWDLNKYRWLCCIIKNENEYETCIPITDMKPLPKTSIKPFPPDSSKAIEP